MANEMMSKAQQNALSVSYEVMGSKVELDLQFVKNYLVHGQGEKITDQEIVFFMNTCKGQKLNPLVAGEAYLIKYGTSPAQLVVGKGAYLRRAFEHPDYIGKQDGIVVQRGHDIIQKEGTCLYPGEALIGGWCRVFYLRHGAERSAFKEVSLQEYSSGQANWKTKPQTMINKVAISQCVREAFPKDYEGLYSEEEMVASGAIPSNFKEMEADTAIIENEGELIVTNDQRQTLFKIAKQHMGAEANEVIKALLAEEGLESTEGMSVSVYNKILSHLMDLIQDMQDTQVPPALDS